MEEILNMYYSNNAQKLRKTVDKILSNFGGWTYKDQDDFYSLANEVFVDVLKRYDNSLCFKTFLYACLFNKIKTEMTRRNREKRTADRISVSIDKLIGDNENSTLSDIIADNFDMDMEVFGSDNASSTKIEKYIAKLSTRQRKIVMLLAESYKAGEIQEKLHISQKEYSDAMLGIRAYENISLLF